MRHAPITRNFPWRTVWRILRTRHYIHRDLDERRTSSSERTTPSRSPTSDSRDASKLQVAKIKTSGRFNVYNATVKDPGLEDLIINSGVHRLEDLIINFGVHRLEDLIINFGVHRLEDLIINFGVSTGWRMLIIKLILESTGWTDLMINFGVHRLEDLIINFGVHSLEDQHYKLHGDPQAGGSHYKFCGPQAGGSHYKFWGPQAGVISHYKFCGYFHRLVYISHYQLYWGPQAGGSHYQFWESTGAEDRSL